MLGPAGTRPCQAIRACPMPLTRQRPQQGQARHEGKSLRGRSRAIEAAGRVLQFRRPRKLSPELALASCKVGLAHPSQSFDRPVTSRRTLLGRILRGSRTAPPAQTRLPSEARAYRNRRGCRHRRRRQHALAVLREELQEHDQREERSQLPDHDQVRVVAWRLLTASSRSC
jgi:hypothetical protein